MKSSYLIAEQIATAVTQMSPDTVSQIADELERLPIDPVRADIARVIRHVQQPAARTTLTAVVSDAESRGLTLSSQMLALALRTASLGRQQSEDIGHNELVWSGPSEAMSRFRRSDQVLADIIKDSKQSLLIVSYAVFLMPHVVGSLREAMERGVSVRLVFESVKESQGRLTFDGIEQVKRSDLGKAELFVWPLSKRARAANGRAGSLHAKCAVADRESALVSSANLTEAALHLNIELGVMIHGGILPGSIVDRFETLVQQNILVRA